MFIKVRNVIINTDSIRCLEVFDNFIFVFYNGLDKTDMTKMVFLDNEEANTVFELLQDEIKPKDLFI